MDFPSFYSLLVTPGQVKRVKLERNTIWCVTHIAVAGEDLPSAGRVVVYATPIINDAEGSKIALTSLTIGKWESSTLDLEFGEGDVIDFSTAGSPIAVTISGHADPASGVQYSDVASSA
jgi:hypothetical protein